MNAGMARLGYYGATTKRQKHRRDAPPIMAVSSCIGITRARFSPLVTWRGRSISSATADPSAVRTCSQESPAISEALTRTCAWPGPRASGACSGPNPGGRRRGPRRSPCRGGPAGPVPRCVRHLTTDQTCGDGPSEDRHRWLGWTCHSDEVHHRAGDGS